MEVLFTSPEQYASKPMSDSPEAIQFINAKTIPSLQKLLNTMCTTTVLPLQLTRHTIGSSFQNNLQILKDQPSLICSISEITVSQGTPPRQLIPPTGVSDQTQVSPLTNQMMDIILQLQNQVQQIQSQAAQTATEEQQEKKAFHKKRITSR